MIVHKVGERRASESELHCRKREPPPVTVTPCEVPLLIKSASNSDW